MHQQDVLSQSGVSRRCTVCDVRPPRALRRRSVGVLLVVALANSACYRYVPVSPTAVTPHEEVRVQITRAAAFRLGGEEDFPTELDGTLSLHSPDSLVVTLPIVRQYRGVTLDSATQTVTLGRSEVVDVRRSQFSRRRTVLTTVGVLAGFALLVHTLVQLRDPNPGSDETPPPPPPPSGQVRLPSGTRMGIRIPIP